jgi:hypothetical protein
MSSKGLVKPNRKVNTILLSEHHADQNCMIRNVNQLMSIVLPKNVPLSKSKFLLVSEGRSINPCYEALKLPVARIIIEHDAEQTINEMLDKLLLQQQLIFDVAANDQKKNGYIIPKTDIVLSKEWFMKRKNSDGFTQLLRMIVNGNGLYERMLDEIFVVPTNIEAVNQIFREILTKIICLLDNSFRREKEILSELIESNKYNKFENFIGLLTYLREKRDRDIIRRVEERVRNEPSIEVVVIIFGGLHYANLKSLIEQSDILKFDATKSLTLGGGFYEKYLKYKQKYIALKKQKNISE